jgi:ribosomal protein L32
MAAARCQSCGHPDHTHRSGMACAAADVTGQPSKLGRAVGDNYEHTGRTVTGCGCTGYTPQLTVVTG